MNLPMHIPAGAMFVFAALSAYLLQREVEVMQSVVTRGPAAVVATGPRGPLSPSHWANELSLRTCDAALIKPYASVYSAAYYEQAATNCFAAAQFTLRNAPTSSFAHYVAAAAAQRQNETALFREHLTLSQRFGAAEGWLSERRLQLAVRAGMPWQDALVASELPVLLATQAGAEMLARFYATVPDARPAIRSAAANAPKPQQQRLLNRITRAGFAG